MALVEALALPAAQALFKVLLDHEPGPSSLSRELTAAFFEELIGEVDAHAASLARLEQRVDLILEQDFARDFGSARLAMLDATRATSAQEADAHLSDAWSRLRSAVAGTQDLLKQADALWLAAVAGLQRHRLVDAVNRASLAWRVATESLFRDDETLRRPAPLPSIASRLRHRGDARAGEVARLLDRCREAADRANAASVLLGELQADGHPTGLAQSDRVCRPPEHGSTGRAGSLQRASIGSRRGLGCLQHCRPGRGRHYGNVHLGNPGKTCARRRL